MVADADGIFMTGGDQKRLLAIIGGTALDAEMHTALKVRGACIGGTSAGASAMSGHMLAQGKTDLLPEKGAVSLGAGLGFLHRVVIDQHFSERQRLSRLLSVVAQNPYLQGIGIDEDTALVVERGAASKCWAKARSPSSTAARWTPTWPTSGARHARTDRRAPAPAAGRQPLLPADGRRTAGTKPMSPSLRDFLENVTKRNPIS
jgi:cyanophycinase